MQTVIIGYVERLHDRMASGDVSIATAIAAQLKSLSGAALIRLRDAALDLVRIIELELGGRCTECQRADCPHGADDDARCIVDGGRR